MPNVKNKDYIDNLLAELNEEQHHAVVHTEGPLLVLAGAGSGKTRVLTFRIAHLIASGAAEPHDILAMTFTNKAAGEMKERVRKLVPVPLKGMWIGTFHSLFARLLRREADRIGYDHNFSIYDVDDQVSLIKSIQKQLNILTPQVSPKLISYSISMAKNAMQSADQFKQSADSPVDDVVSRVFLEYEKQLRRHNAMDFDDLLIKPIELFETYPLVMEYYQERFKFLLVDEYQDTNRAQYHMLTLLAKAHQNIGVVGDDDQSIYRWRGAELRNILEFEEDYPGCKKYHLERNYRSTAHILNLAHSIVVNNTQRHPKKLWTDKGDGEPVSMVAVYNEREEAQMIVEKISQEFRKGERDFSDFAILYRINAQSRALEDAFRAEGIPYVIIGGVRFYERKEIKDVLAYLRLLVNPSDTISLRRVINNPTRGIGDTTLSRIQAFALQQDMLLFHALGRVNEVEGLQKRARERVLGFYEMIKRYQSLLEEISPAELAATLVNELGLIRKYKEENSIESITRLENVQELLQAIAEYTRNNEEATLETYLQEVSLITDLDNWDDDAKAVTLMTLHAAKGLEFPVVFIAGVEEGLFPLSRSMDDPHALEEERRLFYVGATRTQEKLYLFWARNRKRYGETRSYKSRFLTEIDMRFVVQEKSPTLTRAEHSQQRFPTQRSPEPEFVDSMPNYEDESQEPQELYIGSRVKHFKFGKGTVMQIEKHPTTVKLQVKFDRTGMKRLVLPFAKLEIL
ncbi:MAG: UvrD-helicase domain-containing protein [candidate division KSB1 bacterium]|nr:UvrD-helicase domain-containing protein [candidate division KSB1 bacterium]